MEDDYPLYTGVEINGVALARSAKQVAAVSMVPGNSGIWLDSSLSNNARIMMVASGYALILDTWLLE
ncbi:MAG: hypothetical protein AAF404_22525 [Pseudomonadota bacterium]